MGYLRVRVENYIPSLRCTKCQKFGHHFSKCRNHSAICFRCSLPLPLPKVPGMPTKCNNCENNHPNPKCVNCEEDHPSSSKECPKYKKKTRNHVTQIYTKHFFSWSSEKNTKEACRICIHRPKTYTRERDPNKLPCSTLHFHLHKTKYPPINTNTVSAVISIKKTLTPLCLLLHVLKPPPSRDEMTSLSNR